MEDPKRKKNTEDAGWYSWPVIILLFALGLPMPAMILMCINIFGLAKGKKSDSTAPAYTAQRATAAREVIEKRIREAEQRAAEAQKKVQQAQKEEKSSRKPPAAPAGKKPLPGALLRVLGICLLVVGTIVCMDFTASTLQGYWTDLQYLFAGLGCLLSGGIMAGRGRYLGQMARRSQRYIMAIGNVDAMPISEIAKRVNRTPEKAGKELQKLIDKGFLGEDAYIDYEKGWFLRFGASVERPEKEEEPVSRPRESYEDILQNIRRANDRIDDAQLSRKIDRLENISRLIFREVEAHPEKRSRIRNFFDYYLPTTQKLLDAYADFEETGVQGENLTEAKRRIEQTMDTIVDGFAHQLDQLYSTDAMDVVSDIKVMESMLQRDTASAAKDFGYDKFASQKDKPDEGVKLEF